MTAVVASYTYTGTPHAGTNWHDPSGLEREMAPDVSIARELMRDLICRLEDPDEEVRETAVEALAVMTWDEDWRPDEFIRQGGIEALTELLTDDNTHSVLSALDILIAVAASGRGEHLIAAGVIAHLDQIREHDDPGVREKAKDALWLLEPEVEDVVTAKPYDDY